MSAKKPHIEPVPTSGQTSGNPPQFTANAKPVVKLMTFDEIVSAFSLGPYAELVLEDFDNQDFHWDVMQKVMEYANYLKRNPHSVAELPPFVVMDDKLYDGAHRLSALNLLVKRMDTQNPLWSTAKLNVIFVKAAEIIPDDAPAPDANQRR